MTRPIIPNLYPRETETRQIKDLSGLWHIVFDFDDKGEEFYAKVDRIPSEAQRIAVPASYNDQFTDKRIRDFVGTVFYYKEIVIPEDVTKEYFLRFSSANYRAKVFLNGDYIGGHSGGHLPFTLEVPAKFAGKRILLVVSVDNNLSWETVPPGRRADYTLEKEGVSQKRIEATFDFFHYCGLNRRVLLLSVPKTYLADLYVETKEINGDKNATLAYSLDIKGNADKIVLKLSDNGKVVYNTTTNLTKGEIKVDSPRLWEVGKGGLYDFIVELYGSNNELLDIAYDRIGIRTVRVDYENCRFLVNEKPVYFKGFGRHEDFLVCGRNIPDAVLIRDFELMKWTNANSFRTSHYPYSEETMMLADEMGFMVIDEVPAVGFNVGSVIGTKVAGEGNGNCFDLGLINENTFNEHSNMIRELISRDKNRACVVMWSIANEAATGDINARPYFERLYKLTKELDPVRPVTGVSHKRWNDDLTIDIYDVVCLNRYFAWYDYYGDTQVIEKTLSDDLTKAYETFKKPIIITEFGADTVHGLHSLPDAQFSEEFQVEYLKKNFDTFDKLGFVMGEHVWVFADFATKQEARRVLGNRKGIFTRDRQPKAAAFTVRERWQSKK